MKNYRIIKLTNISLSTICGIEANASINIWNNRKFISEYKWQIKDNLINGNFICHDEDYVQVPLDISLKEVDDMIQDIYRMTDVQECNAKVGKVIINRFKEYAIKRNVDHTVAPLVFSKMQNVFDLLSAGMFLEAIDELTSLSNDNVLTAEIKTFYIELIQASNAIHTDIPIPIDPGIESVAGTYKQVEVDMYGRVKTGSNPVTNISDVNGLQDALNGKADDTDLDEYLPIIGGNLEGDLSIKSNTNSRLLGFVVPIDGYNSSSRNTISFRHDKNELAHARLKGYTITETGSKVFGNAVDNFFNEKGTYCNLYDSNNPNSDYSIEITPTNQFNNSANRSWRLIVSFHSGAAFSNLTVDIKNGVDIWTTVYDGYPTSTDVFMYNFTLTNDGAIKSVKFTFTNITGNTYINHLGIEGRLSNLESQWYVNRLGGDVYGNINAYNLLVNNKQVATQEWTTSQDYITKTIADSSYLDSTLKGIPDGVAELDSTGRVPSTQLPSYVDDVVVVESYSSLPTTGENGKIYITLDTNLTYRWNGSGYTEISPSLALGETSTTAYRGDRGKTAYDHSQTSGNPHGTDFSELENKPTTLAGYGITDAISTADGGFYWKGTWDELTAYNSNNAVWYFDNTVTPVVNRLYIAMEPNQGINPVEDTSGIWSEMMRVDTLGDIFVAVDEDDVQTGYLIDKIRNGSGIVVTRHTDSGGNAYLAINSTCLYSVTVGGVTKYSPELGGGIRFTAEGGSVVAWDGNNVKISSVALGETSTTAYRGDRGKVAYDHSQATGNPHGTNFSELENKPTTLAGYGITDAQSITNTLITTQDWNTYTQPGVHKVDNWSGLNGPVVGGIASYKYGQLIVERHIDAVTQIYYPFQSDMGFFRVYYGGWGWGSWKTSPNLTEATIKRDITVSNAPGWYRLGYVDLAPGSYGRVFGSVRCFGRYISADFNFTVTRIPDLTLLNEVILADTSCSQISLQWEVLGDGTIRLSYYIYSIYSNHASFVLYDLGVGGGAVLDYAYTHEYVGATKPTNNELVNRLDRVTLTDASGSSTLPIGDMTQPTAIQTLRNNVKQLQSSTTANGTIYADDWNNFTTTGVYTVINWSGANGPIAGTYSAYKWGQLVVDAYDNVITQKYYPHRSSNIYFRVYYTGEWGDWKTMPSIGETSTTAYRGDRGKVAYDHSQATGNPHGTDFSELENKPSTLAGYGITDGAERYHAFFDPSFFGEGTTSLYGHVRKAPYMTIDDTDVVTSSLMYQNVVQRFHQAAVGAGIAGWLKVCSLTCVGGYTNEPITITLSRRGANKTCRLTIRFQSTNDLNPYIELANYEGQDYGVYYHKRKEGTYDIYVQKSESNDRCNLTEFKSPYNIKLNSENGTVTSVPTGSIAFKRAPSDYSITGKLTSEDWNTFTEVGIYNVAGWSGANGPTINGVQAYKWGFLVVESYQGTVIQTYYPHQSGMPYYRQSWEGGAFVSWSTSPRTGAGLSPSTSIVYQTHATARSDSNAIYLTY